MPGSTMSLGNLVDIAPQKGLSRLLQYPVIVLYLGSLAVQSGATPSQASSKMVTGPVLPKNMDNLLIRTTCPFVQNCPIFTSLSTWTTILATPTIVGNGQAGHLSDEIFGNACLSQEFGCFLDHFIPVGHVFGPKLDKLCTGHLDIPSGQRWTTYSLVTFFLAILLDLAPATTLDMSRSLMFCSAFFKMASVSTAKAAVAKTARTARIKTGRMISKCFVMISLDETDSESQKWTHIYTQIDHALVPQVSKRCMLFCFFVYNG